MICFIHHLLQWKVHYLWGFLWNEEEMNTQSGKQPPEFLFYYVCFGNICVFFIVRVSFETFTAFCMVVYISKLTPYPYSERKSYSWQSDTLKSSTDFSAYMPWTNISQPFSHAMSVLSQAPWGDNFIPSAKKRKSNLCNVKFCLSFWEKQLPASIRTAFTWQQHKLTPQARLMRVWWEAC
jgi:hypothetical protein